jgi:hypothetical protein
MPGNVNNFDAGRSYPMEGAGVMLPQHARENFLILLSVCFADISASAYTDPVEILICGGATTIPTGGVGMDNCLRIAPEVTNSTWLIERAVRHPL